MQIHARKMTVSPNVNFEELARSTDEFNGCVARSPATLVVQSTKIFPSLSLVPNSRRSVLKPA